MYSIIWCCDSNLKLNMILMHLVVYRLVSVIRRF
jgi:hypothetical protein